MPFQVTQNVTTANGTLGCLESVHFAPDTSFRLVRDGATGTVVHMPSRPPDYPLIRVTRPQASAVQPGVDPDLSSVFFATEAYSKTTIKLAPAPDDHPRSITQQFPFVCVLGSKVQCETLQSMVVMDWKSRHAIVNKPQQTYLLVSRVTTRHGLTAISPLSEQLAASFKPPDHALVEEERLGRLSAASLAAFHLQVTVEVARVEVAAEINQQHTPSHSSASPTPRPTFLGLGPRAAAAHPHV